MDDDLNLETPYVAVYALGDPHPPNRDSSVVTSSITNPGDVDEQEAGGGLEEPVVAALVSLFG